MIVILFSAGVSAQRSGKNGLPKEPVTEKVNPLIAEAQKAWPQFWKNFRQAILSHDRATLRKVMSFDFTCGFDIEMKDQKDACLSDWEKSSDNNQIYQDWNDLIEIVNTGKDALKIKTQKNLEDGTLEVTRTISPGGSLDGSTKFLGFAFRNKVWKWITLGVVYI